MLTDPTADFLAALYRAGVRQITFSPETMKWDGKSAFEIDLSGVTEQWSSHLKNNQANQV